MCRMKKSSYEMKQAPRAWYSRIDSYLMSMGFHKSEVDPNIYYIVTSGVQLILLLNVYSLFIIGEEHLIALGKRDLASEDKMNDIGLMYYYPGMDFW